MVQHGSECELLTALSTGGLGCSHCTAQLPQQRTDCILPGGKYQNSKIEVWFLLNVCCFHSLIKSKSKTLSHESGTFCMRCFCFYIKGNQSSTPTLWDMRSICLNSSSDHCPVRSAWLSLKTISRRKWPGLLPFLTVWMAQALHTHRDHLLHPHLSGQHSFGVQMVAVC